MTSAPSSSASTTAVLHQHLVQSALLNSSCHDVTLSCFSRHYRVHRIFLIQSSFFSALLQGQYAEGLNYTVPGNAAGPSGAVSSSSGGGQVLELHFDDPNITRPAFEYCLARLYGSAPQLQLPSWALPTNGQPLSSAWTPASSTSPTHGETSRRPITSTNDLPPLGEGCAMPATPRFLLSLLATSLYLGIPSLTSSTLTLIMASFTPYTVPTYLSFALGKPILGAREARLREEDHDRSWWDWELEGPCWGLEGVGKLVASSGDEEEEDFQSYDPKQESTTPPTEECFDEAEDHKPTRSSSMQGQGAITDFHQAKASRDSTPQAIPPRPASSAPPLLDYGATAHRIAESVFCYLARWGVDLVESEEDKWQQDEDPLDDWIDEAVQSRDGSSSGRQLASILVNENLAPYILPRGHVPTQAGPTTEGPSDPESSTASATKRQWLMPCPPLTIFSHPSSALRLFSRSFFDFTAAASSVKVTPRLDSEDFAHAAELGDDTAGLGLHSAQLADILSSDAFFVRNELERYTLSKRIVEMRRAQQSLQRELVAVRARHGTIGSSSFLSSTKDDTYQSQASDLSRLRLDTPDNSMMDVDDSFRAARVDDFEVVDEDDVHYARLFKDGIYYSHLGFSDLNRISDEAVAAAAAVRSTVFSASQATTSRSSSISSDDEGLSDGEASKQRSFLPTRKIKPQIAAPIEVLQAALWAGHEFENRIRAASSSLDRAANNTDSPRSFEAIQRGRAFSAEGSELPPNPGAFEAVAPNADVEEFAATTTAVRQKEAKEQSEATLGVASDLTSFESVGPPAQASNSTTTLAFSSPRRSHRLAGRASRSVTPASPVNAAVLQGSAADSSSLLPRPGSTTSKANLSKRYFAVPQDDTVRFGEYFSGLISNPPWSVNAAATSTTGLPTGYSTFEHEATGVAAMKDPYSLSSLSASSFMPNRRARNSTLSKDSPHCIRHLDKLSLKGGPLSDVKRAKDNLFGLKNRECTGRTLSKVGADVARQTAALERQGIVVRATVTNAKDGLPSKAAVQEEAANETTVSVGDTTVLGTSPSNEASSNPSSALAFQLAHLSSRTWTPHEPIRIGIEYFSISKLEERSRLYSPSFWYAGSVWNLYVQIIKKPKAKQLGIFLHRQSPHEPLPNASASEEEVRAYHMQRRTSDSNKAGASSSTSTAGHPYPCASLSFLPSPTNGSSSPTMAGRSVESQLQRENHHHNNNTAPLDSPSSHHFVLPPGPPTLPGTCPPIPYRDNRKLVKAYFSIHCHSPLGPSLTRFDSGPDLWKESQSWGWKSSSLLTSFWLEGGVLEGGKGEGTDNVRCTVVMGVV